MANFILDDVNETNFHKLIDFYKILDGADTIDVSKETKFILESLCNEYALSHKAIRFHKELIKIINAVFFNKNFKIRFKHNGALYCINDYSSQIVLNKNCSPADDIIPLCHALIKDALIGTSKRSRFFIQSARDKIKLIPTLLKSFNNNFFLFPNISNDTAFTTPNISYDLLNNTWNIKPSSYNSKKSVWLPKTATVDWVITNIMLKQAFKDNHLPIQYSTFFNSLEEEIEKFKLTHSKIYHTSNIVVNL